MAANTGPTRNFLQRRFGPRRTEDIELPMPRGGKKDPRLETTTDRVRRGVGVLKGLKNKITRGTASRNR